MNRPGRRRLHARARPGSLRAVPCLVPLVLCALVGCGAAHRGGVGASARAGAGAGVDAAGHAGAVEGDGAQGVRDTPMGRRPPEAPLGTARRPAEGIDAAGLRARRAAAVRACALAHDVAAHEGDVLGRYALQGRLSDDALGRHMARYAELTPRAAAAAVCMRREGLSAIATAALLPHLHAATAGLRAQLLADATRWRLPDHVVRVGATLAALRRLAAGQGDALLGDDGGRAIGDVVLVDAAIVPPTPTPVVDARGRRVGLEVNAVLAFAAAPPRAGAHAGLLAALPTGHCALRFVTMARKGRGPWRLRVAPQWRVARCPDQLAGQRAAAR